MNEQDVQLQNLRKTLDEQKALMTQMTEEMQTLGIKVADTNIDLDTLSQTDRQQYLAFERELNEVTDMIKPQVIGKSTTSVSSRPRKRQML